MSYVQSISVLKEILCIEMGQQQSTVPRDLKSFLRDQIENGTFEPFLAYTKFKNPRGGAQTVVLSGEKKEKDVFAHIIYRYMGNPKKRRLIQVTQYEAQLVSEAILVQIEDFVLEK